MSPWDAVLSYHLNPLTCGVAKFNQQLAEQLEIPCLPLHGVACRPLVSVKPSELPDGIDFLKPFDLLLHGPTRDCYVLRAERVFTADAQIADAIRPIRSDVQTLWCPSTLPTTRGQFGLRLLTFGMAHKQQAESFTRLRSLLDSRPFTLSVSSAIHEGSPWQETWQASTDTLQGIFGDHLRVLGFLADAPLSDELYAADAAVLCYDPAVRANNTTMWAVLERGVPLITTLDRWSPPELVHERTCFDLQQLREWPSADDLARVGCNGRDAVEMRGWTSFLSALTGSGVPCGA